MSSLPWKIVKQGKSVKHKITKDKVVESRAEDTCIVDSEGFEVVGCSEWMRGEEHFKRIILCVNACANLSDEELQNNQVVIKP